MQNQMQMARCLMRKFWCFEMRTAWLISTWKVQTQLFEVLTTAFFKDVFLFFHRMAKNIILVSEVFPLILVKLVNNVLKGLKQSKFVPNWAISWPIVEHYEASHAIVTSCLEQNDPLVANMQQTFHINWHNSPLQLIYT